MTAARWFITVARVSVVAATLLAAGTACGADKGSTRSRKASLSSPSRRDSLASPANPQASIYVYVTVDVQYDGFGVYTYRYTVVNRQESAGLLSGFAITPAKQIVSLEAPPNWSVFRGYQSDPEAVAWFVTSSYDYIPPSWDGMSLEPGPYDIQPGGAIWDLTVRSSFPAVPVRYYATVLENVPDQPDTPDEFEQLRPTIFESGVTGFIDGPSDVPTAGVGDSMAVGTPGEIRLGTPNPNPSVGQVNVTFSLPTTALVSLVIRDVSGRLVRTIVDEELGPGMHRASWDGRGRDGTLVRPGVYFYRLRAGTTTLAERRVVIVR